MPRNVPLWVFTSRLKASQIRNCVLLNLGSLLNKQGWFWHIYSTSGNASQHFNYKSLERDGRFTNGEVRDLFVLWPEDWDGAVNTAKVSSLWRQMAVLSMLDPVGRNHTSTFLSVLFHLVCLFFLYCIFLFFCCDVSVKESWESVAALVTLYACVRTGSVIGWQFWYREKPTVFHYS